MNDYDTTHIILMVEPVLELTVECNKERAPEALICSASTSESEDLFARHTLIIYFCRLMDNID